MIPSNILNTKKPAVLNNHGIADRLIPAKRRPCDIARGAATGKTPLLILITLDHITGAEFRRGLL